MSTSNRNSLPKPKTCGTNEQQNKSPQCSHGQVHRDEDMPEKQLCQSSPAKPKAGGKRVQAQILSKGHSAKTESALKASWCLIFRKGLLNTDVSLKALSRAGHTFPPALLHHLPEAHKVTKMCWIHPHFPLGKSTGEVGGSSVPAGP